MRNVPAKLSILVFLGLLVFSTISGAFPADWKEYLIFQKKIQYMEEGIIQCRPSADLWTCEDSYGNHFDNLKIIQVKK
jgi:hypothetical protein